MPSGNSTPAPILSAQARTSTELDVTRPLTPMGKAGDGVDVEALQKRLKLVEQRFAGVSGEPPTWI